MPRSLLSSYLNSVASITYVDMLLWPPEASGSYFFPGGEGQISSIDSLRAMALARKKIALAKWESSAASRRTTSDDHFKINLAPLTLARDQAERRRQSVGAVAAAAVDVVLAQ